MCVWIGLLDSFQRSHACVCCRSPIVLPLSCPRPVHVHQSGCSLIHRTALWKTRHLRMKGSTHEQREREMRQQGSPLSILGTPQLQPCKGVAEYLGWQKLGASPCERETAFECPRHSKLSSPPVPISMAEIYPLGGIYRPQPLGVLFGLDS